MGHTHDKQQAALLLISQHHITAAAGIGPWLASLGAGVALSCSVGLGLMMGRWVQFSAQPRSTVAASVGRLPSDPAEAHWSCTYMALGKPRGSPAVAIPALMVPNNIDTLEGPL